MKKRILGAILLVAICVPLTILGGYYYSALIGLISVLGMWEFNRLYKGEKKLHIVLEVLSYLSVLMIVFLSVGSVLLYLIWFFIISTASSNLSLCTIAESVLQ